MVAVSAEQKPAAPSPESRSKTDTEKKPAPNIRAVSKDAVVSKDTAVSKDEAQEPSPLASTAGQSHADNEKNPHSDRSTKPNSAGPAPRDFTSALPAQSENSDLPPGLARTPVPGLAAPADFGLATAALAVGAAHDGAMPLRLSLNAAGIAPDAANWDGLALRIAAKSAGGESNFQIRLDPPHLGRIEIQLNMDSQGNAQAQLSADRPQTLEALQRDASALERAMKDAGLDLAGGLSFSLKGDGKSAAWRDAQNASRNRVLQIADGAAADTIGATAVNGMGGRGWGLASARLDIRV
jgi:flagellar hook-length control protein FliK